MEQARRLSDKIILAHRQACNENRLDVANLLLQALETDLSAIGGDKVEKRAATAKLEAAFELHDQARGRPSAGSTP